MSLFKNTLTTRWIAIIAAFIVVTLILGNTYTFFQKFKTEERLKMEVLGQAYERLAIADLETEVELERFIISEGNSSIPMIITNGKGEINSWNNINITDSISNYTLLNTKDRLFLNKQFAKMKAQNIPINLSYTFGDTNFQQLIYYRDSDLLNKLKYYPLALVLILILFSSVISFSCNRF